MNSKEKKRGGGHITHAFVIGEREERRKNCPLGEILASTPWQAFDYACPQGRHIRKLRGGGTPVSGHEAPTELKCLRGSEPIVRRHATRVSTGAGG